MKYDLAVIGSSAAGLYAAAVAVAYGKNIIFFRPKGMTENEENIIKSAVETNEIQIMASRRLKQMVSPEKMSDMLVFDKGITGLTEKDEGFGISSEDGEFETETVLCAGVDIVDLLPGEQFFLGRGISYNQNFNPQDYSGKRVGVISFLPDVTAKVEALADAGCEVVFVQYGAGSDKKLPEKVRLIKDEPVSLTGTDHITGISLPKEYFAVDKIFIFRKSYPANIFLPELEQHGRYILGDAEGKTNVEGVWVCGGCAKWTEDKLTPQLQGQIAGMSIVEYLAD